MSSLLNSLEELKFYGLIEVKMGKNNQKEITLKVDINELRSELDKLINSQYEQANSRVASSANQ